MSRKPHTFILYIAAIIASAIPMPAGALSTSTYRSSSRMASGKWVKIKVTETGIHEITHERLRELGFSDPENVTVYGYGITPLLDQKFSTTLPDDLPAMATLHENGKMLFYGEGAVRTGLTGSSSISLTRSRNAYSHSGYYFLSDSSPDERPSIKVNAAGTEQTGRTTHYSLTFDEPEQLNPLSGGTDFFSQELVKSKGYSFKFRFENPASTTARVYIAGAINHSASSSLVIKRTYPAGINSATVSATNAPKKQDYDIYRYCFATDDLTIPTSMAGNDITISVSAPTTTGVTSAYFDYGAAWYLRNNDMTSLPQLTMFFQKPAANGTFTLTGTDPDTRVWCVDEPSSITAYELRPSADGGSTVYGTFTGTVSTTSFTRLVAFSPSRSQLQPEIIGTVPAQDIHGLSTPDLIIVTAPAYKNMAEELADIHRDSQGITVEVLDQEAVFNEFSSGTPHPMGIRRMAKMFYDRNRTKLKNILLYGTGSYMNADHVTPGGNYVMTFQCESSTERFNETKAYTADSYFGMLDDNYDHEKIYRQQMSIGVSRISAPSPAEAAAVNEKVRRYLTTVPRQPAAINTLLACDKGDQLSFIRNANNVEDTISKYATTTVRTIDRIYSPIFQSEGLCSDEIAASLRSGVAAFIYVGHGSSMTFGNIWGYAKAMATQHETLPFTILASCDLFRFDRSPYNSGSGMLFATDGGCISLLGSSRTVYQNYNLLLTTAMARQMYSADKSKTIGEIYRDAHNAIAARLEKPLNINSMCYNLGGDPAIPFYTVSHSARITAVNGSASTRRLGPMTRATFTGEISKTAGGPVDTQFNGTVRLFIYDFPYTLTATEEERNSSNEVITYSENVTLDHEILAEASAEVINGKFEIPLIIPLPQRDGDNNKVQIYAYSSGGDIAAGELDGITVRSAAGDQQVTDAALPTIDEIYLDSPEFVAGECVENNPTLYATISAEAGLNIHNDMLTSCRVQRDGSISYPTVRDWLSIDPATGAYSLSLPLGTMADGKHTLRLTATDNLGQVDTKEINFVIRSSSIGQITVEDPTARTDVCLSLSHPFPSEPKAHLIIEDAWGNHVFSDDNATFPYVWDLRDHTGAPVGDGLYSAYAILSSSNAHGHTGRAEIVVIR